MASEELKIGIGADNSKLKGKLKESGMSVKQFGRTLQTALGFGIQQLLFKMVNGLRQIATESLKVHARYERLGLTFRKLLSSDVAGKQLMDQLREFSVATPFEPEDVFKASKQLLAFGVVAKDQVKTVKMLGDMASVSGKPLEELAFIYGKVFSRGRAQAREMNQMIRAQIPIVREVAKVMGVSENAVAKLTEEGKVSFEIVKKALQNLTSEGGQFFNMTEEHAKTMEGRWSTLVGAVKDAGDAIANLISPAAKTGLELLIRAAAATKEIAQGLGTGQKGEAEVAKAIRIISGGETTLERLRAKKAGGGELTPLEQKALMRAVKIEQNRLRAEHKKFKDAMSAVNAKLLPETSGEDVGKMALDPRSKLGLFNVGMITQAANIPQMQLDETKKQTQVLEEIKTSLPAPGPEKWKVYGIDNAAGIRGGAI